jgi:hypothetical protein
MKIVTIFVSLFVFLLVAAPGWAEGTIFDYSGYLEVNGISQTENDNFFLGSVNLPPVSTLGSYIKWQNDLRIIPNDQVTLKFRVSYLNDTVNTSDDNEEFVLSRGFIDFTPNDVLSIRFGKQRLGWGTGYAWNPIDILDQPRNAFTALDDPEGVMAFRTDLHFGPINTQIVITPDVNSDDTATTQDWNSAGRAIRFKVSPGGVDLSLGMVQDGEQSSAAIADFAWSILGIGFHGEASYQADGNSRDDKKEIFNYLLGADYNFPGGYYLAIEYYHNDEAYKDIDELKTALYMKGPDFDAISYLTDLASNGGVLQDHIFLHGSKLYGDNYNVDLMLVYATGDQSLVVQPEFDYIWKQNTRLFVKALLPVGDSDSEANVLPVSSWKLGLKVNY